MKNWGVVGLLADFNIAVDSCFFNIDSIFSFHSCSGAWLISPDSARTELCHLRSGSSDAAHNSLHG